MSKPSECGSPAHLQTMILDQITDAVIAIDRNRCIVYWNRGAERLCHLSACNALGKRPQEVQLSPWLSAEEEEAVFSALERDEVRCLEGVRSTPNGNALHLESSITLLTTPDGESIGLLVVMRDITNVKQREHDQEQRIEALRRASNSFRVLEGLIPICAHCRQIRDEAGSWHEPDVYFRDQVQVKFTHGICPACAQILHPEYFGRLLTAP
jgi:PAS domain S-box-containing protein